MEVALIIFLMMMMMIKLELKSSIIFPDEVDSSFLSDLLCILLVLLLSIVLKKSFLRSSLGFNRS